MVEYCVGAKSIVNVGLAKMQICIRHSAARQSWTPILVEIVPYVTHSGALAALECPASVSRSPLSYGTGLEDRTLKQNLNSSSGYNTPPSFQLS